MSMLRDAVAKGYKDAARMKKDQDLDSLRSREDFKQLLADLEAKYPQPPAKAEAKLVDDRLRLAVFLLAGWPTVR
jgi:hypothetical protein